LDETSLFHTSLNKSKPASAPSLFQFCKTKSVSSLKSAKYV
jgi:hypothetical protein